MTRRLVGLVVQYGGLPFAALLFASSAPAVTLSGTVQYNGSLGPVAATRPIRIELSNKPSKQLRSVAHTTIKTNGGRFDVSVANGGTYYLWFFLDVNDDGRASPGEPFQVYNQRFTLPGDPLTVPASGLSLSLDDSALFSGVAGKVTYTGALGQVSATNLIIVQAFSDADLTRIERFDEVAKNGAPYQFTDVVGGTNYLKAFFDVNGNRRLDPGEPFTIYNDRDAPPGDPVDASPMQTGVDISFGDAHLAGATALAMATPTPTPTPGPCLGSCTGNGAVTVSDVLTLVRIVLGEASPSACPAGGGQPTIGTVLTAVDDALAGCRS